MNFCKTKIFGTGDCYPKKIVTNDDLSKTIDTNDEWIYERTGIKERRVADVKAGETPVELAYGASIKALKNANMSPNDIDLIVFGTVYPDFKIPNCASLLQTKLGITNHCGIVDLSAACSGFVYGLALANGLVKTGSIKNALVIGSEVLSTNIDWSDRGICILFGDGAGAAIVGKNDDANDPSDIHSSILGGDGTGRQYFFQDIGGIANPLTKENIEDPQRFMQMQGREMFRVATRTLAETSLKAIEQAKMQLEDIDWLVPHQANIRIIESTGKRLGIESSKVMMNIEKYANTSAATIPTAFHQGIEAGKIKRGDKILFSAFGAGLTAGSIVLTY